MGSMLSSTILSCSLNPLLPEDSAWQTRSPRLQRDGDRSTSGGSLFVHESERVGTAHIRLARRSSSWFLRFARTPGLWALGDSRFFSDSRAHLARTEEQLSHPDRFAHLWIALSLGPSIYSGSLLVCRARWNELFAWMSMMSELRLPIFSGRAGLYTAERQWWRHFVCFSCLTCAQRL